MVTDETGVTDAGHGVFVRKFNNMFSIMHPREESECIMYINPMVIMEQDTLVCPHCGFRGKLINMNWIPE